MTTLARATSQRTSYVCLFALPFPSTATHSDTRNTDQRDPRRTHRNPSNRSPPIHLPSWYDPPSHPRRHRERWPAERNLPSSLNRPTRRRGVWFRLPKRPSPRRSRVRSILRSRPLQSLCVRYVQRRRVRVGESDGVWGVFK
jgi:hypothetical protein